MPTLADLDALAATVRAGDTPAAHAAIRALGELDDDRARAVLAELLAPHHPLSGDAIEALGKQGAKAEPVAIAATLDPVRKVGGVAVLGELGAPSSRARLRGFVEDADPMMRLTAASSLFRCGERDRALWSAWIVREADLGVAIFLAAVGGAVELDAAALDRLAGQAETGAAPELRAGAAWAVTQHDAARGTTLARAVLAEPEAASALASVVRRRGGPLTPLIAGIAGEPAADWTADSVGLPPAS